MLKVGDTVKVISDTMHQGKREELIPLGTVCTVVGTMYFADEEEGAVGIVPENESLNYHGCGEFWYLESEVEKGHMEWVKDAG